MAEITGERPGVMTAAGDERPLKAPADPERHRRKMATLKAAKEKIWSTKTRQGGVVLVNTGLGKGKTTAAMGLAVRMLGHGRRVGLVQFVKGKRRTGEREFFASLSGAVTDRLVVKVMGEGFTWDTQSRERDGKAAQAAWDEAQAMLADPTLALVVLDEICIVMRNRHLEAEEVVAALRRRPSHMHVVLTGRHAPEALVEAADAVSDFRPVKHHYASGYRAQAGMEF